MVEEKINKKRSFQMPHVFVIIFAIMILVTLLSYIIPSGVFERITSESGVPIVNPDNFTFVENENPISFQDFFSSIYTGFVEGATIIGSLLICSGCLAIFNQTGALESGINKLIKVSHGKNIVALIIFYIYFAGMNIMGAGETTYPFFPIVTAIIVSLGYDKLTAAGTILFASTAGFACGMVNLFTTGISQQIVGLPMFSGIGYRFIVFVVLFIIGLVSVLLYSTKIKKDPNKSYIASEYKQQLEEAKNTEKEDDKIKSSLNGKQIATLILFLAVIIFTAYGCLKLGFGLGQFAAYYVVFAIIIAFVFKIDSTSFCKTFTKGASQVLTAAFAIGLARSVMVLLNQGKIMDTLVYYMGNSLQGKSTLVTILLIYLFVTAMNFLVTSGSGKAVMMMPIMSPLGSMLGINQQVMVLTYQLGDGLTNQLWPSAGLVACSLCGVDYSSWLKMSWKTFAIMIASGYVLIVIANSIGYGPF